MIAVTQHAPARILVVSIQRETLWHGENVVAWVAPGPHILLRHYAIFWMPSSI
jgi:hypothetical protein